MATLAEHIATLKASGNLVLGWQCDTPERLDDLVRRDYKGNPLTHYVADNNSAVLLRGGSPYAVRAGWKSGTDESPAWGAEGGAGRFPFDQMAPRYGSPGVNPRFACGDIIAVRWYQRVNKRYIGMASQTDSGFAGGIKQGMIDFERGLVNPNNGQPSNEMQGYSTNGPGEIVITTGSGIYPVSARHPSRAGIGAYGTSTHISFSQLPNVSGKELRPDVWMGVTVQVGPIAPWTYRIASWMTTTPGKVIGGRSAFLGDDYRLWDDRWIKSTQQLAARDAGNWAGVKAAPYSQTATTPFRVWRQYEDGELIQTHDTKVFLFNSYWWGNPADPSEAAYGVFYWFTLAYKAAQAGDPTLRNWYGDMYTPYLQQKPMGDELFPDRFGPAATEPTSIWFDTAIVHRGPIDLPMFPLDSGGEPPMSAVTVPHSMNVRFS